MASGISEDATYNLRLTINTALNNGSSVNGLTLTNGGSGFQTDDPAVSIGAPAGQDGVQATASATVVDGTVTQLVLNANGSGYTAIPQVTVPNNEGTQATGQATISPSSYTVDCEMVVTTETSGATQQGTNPTQFNIDMGFDSYAVDPPGASVPNLQWGAVGVTTNSSGTLVGSPGYLNSINPNDTLQFFIYDISQMDNSNQPGLGMQPVLPANWFSCTPADVTTSPSWPFTTALPSGCIPVPQMLNGVSPLGTSTVFGQNYTFPCWWVCLAGSSPTNMQPLILTVSTSVSATQSYNIVLTLNTVSSNGSGSAVNGFSVTEGGSGYTNGESVQFSGGGGSGATATLNVTNGAITSVTLGSGGSGYTTPPQLTLPGGSDAVVSAVLAPTSYSVDPEMIVTSGSGTGGDPVP